MSNFLDNVEKLAVITFLFVAIVLGAAFAVYMWIEIIIPKL